MPKTINLSVVTHAKDQALLQEAILPLKKWVAGGVVVAICALVAAILLSLNTFHFFPPRHSSLFFLRPESAALAGLVGLALIGLCYRRYRNPPSSKIQHARECVSLGEKIEKAEGAEKKALTLDYLQKKHVYLTTKHLHSLNVDGMEAQGLSYNFPIYEELERYLEPISCDEEEARTTIVCDLFDGVCCSAVANAAQKFLDEGRREVDKDLFQKGVPFEVAIRQFLLPRSKNFHSGLFDSLWHCIEMHGKEPAIFRTHSQAWLKASFDQTKIHVIQIIYAETENYLKGSKEISYSNFILACLTKKFPLSSYGDLTTTFQMIEESLKAGIKKTAECNALLIEASGLKVTKHERLDYSSISSMGSRYEDGVYLLGLITPEGSHAVLLTKTKEHYALLDPNDRLYTASQPEKLIYSMISRYSADLLLISHLAKK